MGFDPRPTTIDALTAELLEHGSFVGFDTGFDLRTASRSHAIVHKMQLKAHNSSPSHIKSLSAPMWKWAILPSTI